MEIISKTGTLIAIVVEKAFDRENGINFVSKKEFPLQLGKNFYRRGAEIMPHSHISRKILIHNIQEIVHIDNGKVKVDLYDEYDKKFKSVDMESGDTIFFVSGGHGLKILEDTEIIEIKQGPYEGKNNDKRMIGGIE